MSDKNKQKNSPYSSGFMRFSNSLRKEILHFRQKANLTLEEAEDKSRGNELKWRHLQKIESGERSNITLETLYKICKIYKKHPSDLFKDVKF